MSGHRSLPKEGSDSQTVRRRRKHLIDPSAPRQARDPEAAARSLSRVQKWVMSTLAVTTILHLSVGLVVASMFLRTPDLSARVGLNVIAGVFGVIAVAAGLAIHRRKLLSPWLVLGIIPGIIGVWLTLG